MNRLARSRPARLLGALLLLAALTGRAYYAGFSRGREVALAAPAAPGARPLGEQARREASDPFALGNVDAPVALVVFSDYRCPFCARYSQATEPELVARYVDAGKLRIEWRDFPIFGDASLLAARAGRAAAAQGKFWEFNRAVYAAAPASGHHDLTEAKLRAFAEQVGVADLARFEREIADETHDAAIARDFQQARGLGVTGTPSFVIGGRPLVGAQPTEVFVRLIDEALMAAD